MTGWRRLYLFRVLGPPPPASETGLIPSGKHLGVLIDAHETIGPWIARMA